LVATAPEGCSRTGLKVTSSGPQAAPGCLVAVGGNLAPARRASGCPGIQIHPLETGPRPRATAAPPSPARPSRCRCHRRPPPANLVMSSGTRSSTIGGRPKTLVARNFPRFTNAAKPSGYGCPCKGMRSVISAVPRRPLMLLLYVPTPLTGCAGYTAPVSRYPSDSWAAFGFTIAGAGLALLAAFCAAIGVLMARRAGPAGPDGGLPDRTSRSAPKS
jgi:hypothetical protein